MGHLGVTAVDFLKKSVGGIVEMLEEEVVLLGPKRSVCNSALAFHVAMEKSVSEVGASGNSLVLNRPHEIGCRSIVRSKAVVDGNAVDKKVLENLGVPE